MAPGRRSVRRRRQVAQVPSHGLLQPVGYAVRGDISQQSACFTDVGLRVAHVAFTKSLVTRKSFVHPGAVGEQQAALQLEQLVQRGALADGNVVDLVQRGTGRPSIAASRFAWTAFCT